MPLQASIGHSTSPGEDLTSTLFKVQKLQNTAMELSFQFNIRLVNSVIKQFNISATDCVRIAL